VLENNERHLVTAAEAIVRSLPDNDTHTVASAAMDTQGNVHTGVNVFHFTGGPCAELVVIAAAAQALVGPWSPSSRSVTVTAECSPPAVGADRSYSTFTPMWQSSCPSPVAT